MFTFNGEHNDDLWCQPFIKLDEEHFTIINTSLKTPNLLRCLGVWLKNSGLDKGWLTNKLGELFEKYIRTKLKQCNKLINVKVYDVSIDFGREVNQQKETDLIISIGNKIVIGEIKHRSQYPTESIEYDYYYQELEKAGQQLAKRKEFIENNLDVILAQLKLTHIKSEKVEIIAIIISNLPLATGHTIGGFSVIDISILEMYLSSGTIKYGIAYNQDGKLKKEMNEEIKLYSSEKDAEENIGEYLRNPPQLQIISKQTKWVNIQLPNMLDGIPSIYCYKPTVDNIYFNSSI